MVQFHPSISVRFTDGESVMASPWGKTQQLPGMVDGGVFLEIWSWCFQNMSLLCVCFLVLKHVQLYLSYILL